MQHVVAVQVQHRSCDVDCSVQDGSVVEATRGAEVGIAVQGITQAASIAVLQDQLNLKANS